MASSTSNFQEREQYSVYVGNLPDGILQSHVEQKIFAGLNVESVRLVKDRETDKFRGFAYVDLRSKEDFESALRRNGTMINERPLKISPSERKNNQNNNRGGLRGGAVSGRNNYSNNRGNYQNNNRGPYQNNNFPQNGNNNRPYSNNSQNNNPRNSGWQESGGSRNQAPRYSQHPGGPDRGGAGGQHTSYGNNPMSRRSNHPRGDRGPGSSSRGTSGKGRSTISNEEFKYVDDPNRPRIKIANPEAILNAPTEAELSDKFKRNVSIFGEGKPREASPVRPTLD